ncbi:MAG TPA: MFS transporter [Solirubrobacteraceae bacterium]|jgi:MFS family permease|nr:MFS transporter [Solirubrobacteraceae bacterium]
MTYRRNTFTWTAFGALFAFGYLNAVLGPALPYLRSVEGISYLVGALHQVAYAVGGGIAGTLSARSYLPFGRRSVTAVGLAGAGLAALAVGYGNAAPITIAGALLMGMLGTLALIRVWAALADAHGPRRAVALSEGEVAVSLAGIATPLLIGALAGSAATWRLAFAIGTATIALAVVGVLRADLPSPHLATHEPTRDLRLQPTLVIIFAIVALEFALSFWLASYLNDDVGLTRQTAVALVSLLYAANLTGRLLASRLARTHPPEHLLFAAIACVVAGLPCVLAATSATAAVAGIVLTGTGIGALFPLTSSLHVQSSGHTADSAVGEVLSVAALGQIAGPLLAGAIAQASSLRAGLLVLPAMTLLAAAGLTGHQRHTSSRQPHITPARIRDQ